jgi:ABC-2 type transport system permease protein
VKKMKALRKYIKAYLMGLQSAMEYRTDFILSILSGAFVILIQCFLWTAIFKSSKNSIIYGYTFSQMITYSIMAGLVAKIVATGFEWEIAEDIKNGGLNKFIVQPIGYFNYRVACFIGRKALQLSVMFVICLGALLFCNTILDLELKIIRVLIFLPFAFLAMLLNFLIYYALSTLAFIMTEVWGVFIAAGQGILMLSGGIFPLDVFGKKVSNILSLLPFKYIIFYPVNIVNGRLSFKEIFIGAIIQAFWIIIMFIVANSCWKSGMRKYVAVGG